MKCKLPFKLLQIIGLALVLIFAKTSFAFAQGTQDQFIIGAWVDPDLTGNIHNDVAELEKYINAHFNLLTGYSNVNSNEFSTTDPGRPITNEYLIDLVADRNVAHGSSVLGVSINDDDFTSVPVNISDYKNLTGAASDALYGYSVIHEPTAQKLNNDLNIVKQILSNDPDRFTFDVLAGIWRVWDGNFQTSWTKYENYVADYINHPSTKIASFDYYVLVDQSNDGILDYQSLGADRVNYFRTTHLFAEKTRSSKKTFWGFSNSAEYLIKWFDSSGTHIQDDHYILPTDAMLRYNAFSQIIYGAKGIIWFTYELPGIRCPSNPTTTCEHYIKSPNSDDTLYNRVREVNLAITNMGPTLMQLNWITTVHGSDTDPDSGENELPTVNSSTPVLDMTDFEDEIAIGIHTHRQTGQNYLTVFNKSLANAHKNIQLTTRGYGQPYAFDKTHATWTRIPQVINQAEGSTSFSISLQPGDIELISIQNDLVKPLHQYWNSGLRDHFYTTEWQGYDNGHGWNYEVITGYVFNTQVEASVPLYQYWHPGIYDHFYTTEWLGEKTPHGWIYETIIGYVFNTQIEGSIPLYRYWNVTANDHFYTTEWQGEKTPGGWEYELIECYVVPSIIIRPLFQYWNPDLYDHYYTTGWQGYDNGHGWNYEVITGYVFSSKIEGSEPLYQYWNPVLYDHFYTTEWQGYDNGHGWNYEVITGYVFSSKIEGSVPLYQYWNPVLYDHFYTTEWQGYDNGHGWLFEIIAGYVIGPVASTTVIGRDHVDFDPITSTYYPTFKTCGCTPENDFVGKFSFEATLKNKGSTPLSGLMVEVTDLENVENGKRENRLILPDGNMGGVGAIFPIPRKDEYLDGVLRTGESVTVHFDLCLGSWNPFLFYVNVLGIVE